MKKLDWLGPFIWALIILISVETLLSLFMIVGNVLTLMLALAFWFISATICSYLGLWVFHKLMHRYDQDVRIVYWIFFGTAVGLLFRLLS